MRACAFSQEVFGEVFQGKELPEDYFSYGFAG
jgi:hypothetical protein